MYLGALCSGILESLAEVEKAAVAALSVPHHQRRLGAAIRRALRLHGRKPDDPENPPCSPAKKQALQQTWMEMLSATNIASQNGKIELPLMVAYISSEEYTGEDGMSSLGLLVMPKGQDSVWCCLCAEVLPVADEVRVSHSVWQIMERYGNAQQSMMPSAYCCPMQGGFKMGLRQMGCGPHYLHRHFTTDPVSALCKSRRPTCSCSASAATQPPPQRLC